MSSSRAKTARPLTRRHVLLGIAASAARLEAQVSSAEDDAAELAELDAVAALERMARGEVSAERYARALLARCAAGASLNAWISLEPERVLEAARDCDRARRAGERLGPLAGLPMPIKDSVNTAQYPTTAGTPALRSFRPRHDAPVVHALRRAGAVVLGKTNLHELSYGWTSNNQAYGAVRNPYQPHRIPGGSSGGTAAAIAARMAPLGVAEDTQGSIRVPAALCGLYALRPTTGRYSTQGAVPITPLFDQVGPHARSVRDLALFDAVLTGAPPRAGSTRPLRGTRLAVVRDYFFTDLDPEVEQLSEQALAQLRAAGAELIEAQMPGLAALIERTTDPIQNHDVRFALPAYLKEYGAPVSFEALLEQASADIRETFRRDVLPGGEHFVSAADYAAARTTHLPALRRLYRDVFARSGADAVVFPATLVPAPLIGEEAGFTIRGRRIEFETGMARNISPGSTAGVPGLVVPIGLTAAGLPVALEFDAPAGGDRELLALGAAVESLLQRLPPPPRAGLG